MTAWLAAGSQQHMSKWSSNHGGHKFGYSINQRTRNFIYVHTAQNTLRASHQHIATGVLDIPITPIRVLGDSPVCPIPHHVTVPPLTLLKRSVGDLERSVSPGLDIRGCGVTRWVCDEAGDAALLTADHAAGVQQHIGRRVDKHTWRPSAETQAVS